MKYITMMIMIFGLSSCASMNEKVPGYSQSDIGKMKDKLKGKNRDEMVATLGAPIAEGLCYSGSSVGVGKERYTLIYRKEDSVRYKHAMDMTTKSYDLKCTIIHLTKKVDGKYTFSGYGSAMDQVGCNQDYGVVKRVRNPNKCKQIYKGK